MARERVILITEALWQDIRRRLRKVDNITGDGVTNSPDAVSIGQAQRGEDAPPMRNRNQPILARVTGVGDNDAFYCATPVLPDDTAASGTPWDGEEGNRPQVSDISGAKRGVLIGTLVELHLGVDSEGEPLWWFIGDLRPGKTFEVIVDQVGGSDGGETTAATWTYDAEDLDGEPLGSAMTPANQRPTVGTVLPATKGYGYWFNGAFVLGLVNEVADQEGCPEPEA